ncbi:hypothetical protein POSPLADRAFT_1048695 [Postia placenta MAD-698-R-SB12]|uniref:Autophagy-related protein 29 n=1 Tax=Postia placenta MAD-698-R-SB12 TaxID=670580 RepID=A0A1X6MSK6_9APHY|nr:hypothetical protein POSPLADRAFT_1048695 [Postia placenta MAD-698-R-SB12]OSX59358.1 hypothetical protein POSPLADRAFT_1048695 [Postia placenta MAD-698-R-SB12]
METNQPRIRVVVRLPYDRTEESLPDPPVVEWNQEKESLLWSVITLSRERGTDADWRSLATHLSVPLPYLLYRAQTRYEEGIRGLQGIRGALSPPAPSTNTTAFPSHPATSPTSAHPPHTNEYFPRLSEVAARRLSNSPASPNRPLGVRARLSSLGQSQRTRRQAAGRLLVHCHPRHRMQRDDEDSEDSDEDEDAKREEEEDQRAEQQQTLERKLRELELMMSKDALGLVASPKKENLSQLRRGRPRPLSTSTASLSSAHPSTSRSQQSLSSLSSRSPHGSIPSIPSSPPHTQHVHHWRSHPDSRTQQPHAREESESSGRSSPRHASPISRHFSPSGKTGSPGSEASSFSDLSDASVSASALASALESNVRAGGSRLCVTAFIVYSQ